MPYTALLSFPFLFWKHSSVHSMLPKNWVSNLSSHPTYFNRERLIIQESSLSALRTMTSYDVNVFQCSLLNSLLQKSETVPMNNLKPYQLISSAISLILFIQAIWFYGSTDSGWLTWWSDSNGLAKSFFCKELMGCTEMAAMQLWDHGISLNYFSGVPPRRIHQ